MLNMKNSFCSVGCDVNDNKPITRTLANAIAELLSSPTKELSNIIADRLRFYRWKSLLRIAQRATEIRREYGIPPNTVPIKLLIPLLEEGSKEDEESEMLEIWAKLLANSDIEYNSLDLIAVDLLSKITSSEAKILDILGTTKSWRDFPDRLFSNLPSSDEFLELSLQEGGLNKKRVQILYNLLFDDLRDNLKHTWKIVTCRYKNIDEEEPGIFTFYSNELGTDNESLFSLKKLGLVSECKWHWILARRENGNAFLSPDLGSLSAKRQAFSIVAILYDLTEEGIFFWNKLNPDKKIYRPPPNEI